MKLVGLGFILMLYSVSVYCQNTMLRVYNNQNQTLAGIYRSDAVKLLEVCISRSDSHKLMEGNTSVVVKNLATELAALPISSLVSLCESIPTIPLYLSRKNHDALAYSLLESFQG